METVGASPVQELSNDEQVPVLIVAFPTPCATPLPLWDMAVGRKWLMTLGIDDPLSSEHHAMFSKRGGVNYVEDAGSTNGTFVDGDRIQPGEPVPLQDGTVLRLGRTLFVYRARLTDGLDPSEPMGDLIAPYGLTAFRSAVSSMARRQVRNVLIRGETGTGKELAARFVAQQLRPGGPFLPINVAAVASELFEAQMFGHVAGAFTGAKDPSLGFFRECTGGCIFLDEIGELPKSLQPKLLRVIENREVVPVGSVRPEIVDVVVIAATNRDLEAGMFGPRFRRDLLARFLPGAVELSPLRKRREDIFAIAQALAEKAAMPISPEVVEVEALELLMQLELPGNVRELESIVTRALAETPGATLLLRAVEKAAGTSRRSESQTLTKTSVEKALERHGNESQAARALGVTRSRLRRFMASLKRKGEG